MKIEITPPQNFLEFLKASHESLKDYPDDQAELNVHEDFDTWLQQMSQEEWLGWAEAFRDEEVANYSKEIEKISKIFSNEL